MDDLSLSLLDICMNSAEADASTVKASIMTYPDDHKLEMTVEDDGVGMENDVAEKATDPFYTQRPSRKVGLGLPLLKHAATNTGGDFHIRTRPGKGTIVRAVFHMDHVDMPNLGDLASSVLTFVLHPKTNDFTFTYGDVKNTFVFDLNEILRIIDKDDLSNGSIRRYIYDMLQEGINMKEGENHEDIEGIKTVTR